MTDSAIHSSNVSVEGIENGFEVPRVRSVASNDLSKSVLPGLKNTHSNGPDNGVADKPLKDLTPPLEMDPLLIPPSATVREGDHVLLLFGDRRQIFAHCVTSWKGKNPPVKISKRSYPTANLVGLPYGTVLELDHTRGGLVPLPHTEDVMPDYSNLI